MPEFQKFTTRKNSVFPSGCREGQNCWIKSFLTASFLFLLSTWSVLEDFMKRALLAAVAFL